MVPMLIRRPPAHISSATITVYPCSARSRAAVSPAMPPPMTSASSSCSMASDMRTAPFHCDGDAPAGAEGRHPRRVLARAACDHDLNAFWSACHPVVTVGCLDGLGCDLRLLSC